MMMMWIVGFFENYLIWNSLSCNIDYYHRLTARLMNWLTSKCLVLVIVVLFIRVSFLPFVHDFCGIDQNKLSSTGSGGFQSRYGIRRDKFLQVPQIVWGLNNQKIAFARACLTARMLNRTLLMPNLSASLFYKDVEELQPISFEKVFQFDKFNLLCDGFVQLGRHSRPTNKAAAAYELRKGSGRRWTINRDLDQLKEISDDPFDQHELIRIVGKNPFLWHDHWPVTDYARIFQCLVLAPEIADEAHQVISRIREAGRRERSGGIDARSSHFYVAVHMRMELDWMIHCKKLQQRLNTSQICSSKKEIMDRVGGIVGLKAPTAVYLAVADNLVEGSSVLTGWSRRLIPLEKKKLGVDGIYKKHPYLIQSAIDYEVCLQADVFVGNSFSTFSSLVVLERTQKMIAMGIASACGEDARWPCYSYNIRGNSSGPRRWITNMSDSNLNAISYGSELLSC